jgi:hypothetical protein
MPSGYTYRIEEDPDFSFEDFAWCCAKAFLIEMKEAPADARVPEQVKLSPAYQVRINMAKEEILRLETLSDEAIAREVWDAFLRTAGEREKADAKQRQFVARYDAMRAKVEAWQHPEQLQGLYEFMVRQIEDSTRYMRGDRAKPEAPDVTPEGVAAWRAQHIQWAKQDLTRAEEEYARAVEGVRQKNEWLTALREAVGPQP